MVKQKQWHNTHTNVYERLGSASGHNNPVERQGIIRRLPEKNIPECAGFSFVFKAGFFVHSGSMCGKTQRRIRVKRQAVWYIF
jgi:hypothetical protein